MRLGTHAEGGAARGADGGAAAWRSLSADVEAILREGAPAFLPERPRANKNSCGYDLWGAWAPGDQVSSIAPRFDPMRLIVGSEGTLGIVTEVTMRLVPSESGSAVHTKNGVLHLPGFCLELVPAGRSGGGR